MAFTKVCSLDDVWEGDMESFDVDGREVLIVCVPGGELHAYQGVCPHQDIPLIEGKFDGKLLVCRAHQWVFDGASGTGINPANCRLARYPLRIDGDDVYVDTDGITPLFATS